MSAGLVPLLLVFGLALSSAGFDLFRKVLSRDIAPVPLVFLLATASVPLFGVMVTLDGGAEVGPGYLVPALSSVILNLLANFSFLQSVRLSPLSLTVPLLSLTPVFTVLLGMLLLDERPGWGALAGILLVVAGTFWLTADGGLAVPGGDRRTLWQMLSPQPGSRWMAATAMLMSWTIPLDKMAVGHATAPFHGLVLTVGIGAGSFAVLAAQGRWRELAGIRRRRGAFVLALVSSTLALAFQLFVLKFLLVGLIEALKRGIGNLMAMLLGRMVLGEPVTVGKTGAVLLMAVGVLLILA